MKIVDVSCQLLRVPYSFPRSKTANVPTFLFVEIKTDEGINGYAASVAPMPRALASFVATDVRETLLGMDPIRTEEIRRKLLTATAFKYFLGAWSCVISLVDIAVWDVRGKAFGQPIWKLLGGAKSELPAYVTFGLSTYSDEELVEVALNLVAEGHRGLKMIVGATLADDVDKGFGNINIARDARRVSALRKAVGPDVAVMIDANKSLNLTQATWLAEQCADLNLAWFEDPVLQGDVKLTAELRRRINIPIAVGSTGTSDVLLLREYIEREAVDYLQPNVRDIGGFTAGAKAASLAQIYNIPLASGGDFPFLNMQLQGGFLNGGPVEFHYQGWKCYETLFEGTTDPKAGRITLPDRPGLGLTPRDDIGRWRADA